MKLLSKVKSGDLWYCKNCQSFHLMFNNLFFALNHEELKRLKSYIDGLEIGYWEHKYACSDLKRKIPLATNQQNLVVMFNRQEIIELRALLKYSNHKGTNQEHFIGIDDIDYKLILN
ncbi:DUF6686 family protein [Winogradskyella sp.]|uniref:DUF6686 family protein n=1 Tax=Winogradskyella sp. TaxID=1883156 RepID=UPI0026038DF0|nr:DUF6686 family protein [Winogradskyella sp.]